jgi:hypothetical protein
MVTDAAIRQSVGTHNTIATKRLGVVGVNDQMKNRATAGEISIASVIRTRELGRKRTAAATQIADRPAMVRTAVIAGIPE